MKHIVVGLAHCFAVDVKELEIKCFSEPWSFTAISNSLNDAHSYGFAIFKDRSLTAYGLMQVVCDEGDVLRIAVDPAFQNKGMGLSIMQAMACKASILGLKRLTLELRSSNKAAAALYTKAGFIIDGLRKNYYKNPVEDGILMSRSINLNVDTCN